MICLHPSTSLQYCLGHCPQPEIWGKSAQIEPLNRLHITAHSPLGHIRAHDPHLVPFWPPLPLWLWSWPLSLQSHCTDPSRDPGATLVRLGNGPLQGLDTPSVSGSRAPGFRFLSVGTISTDRSLPGCSFSQLPYWFLNFTIINFILKFNMAKGKVCRKTWHEIFLLCVPPPLALGHNLHGSEPQAATGTTNAKNPREIFSHLSQMWLLLNAGPHKIRLVQLQHRPVQGALYSRIIGFFFV